ncbi:TPA: type II toxin-antitoxin system ParD family antitoxin [Salmonella enterica subsp. enterica serovar Indiana]|nr:type II toxin-antitoxin system ParD family antitoxin [Salmonella enterica subsp. enterica serovar Indiana]
MFLTYISFQVYSYVRFILTVEAVMARTMTVDLGDELREFIESLIESGDYRTQSEVIRESLRLLRGKQAESRLQALRELLAEGLNSGEPQAWEKDAFLRKVKTGMIKPDENGKINAKGQ